jgi:hypothetical protein
MVWAVRKWKEAASKFSASNRYAAWRCHQFFPFPNQIDRNHILLSGSTIRMNRMLIALLMAVIAGPAIADPVPVTNTTKRPFKESKVYCNDAKLSKPSKGENIACYNHDACYSDPQGRSRKDCDEGYLRDMKLAGVNSTMALIRFKAVRNWGEASWDRSRKNDEWQISN